jgi:UDPglucose 6-dehydrogenase
VEITIFGSGYVGLVTAACFADAGNSVLCVDIDTAKVAKLRGGYVPFYEPGLEDLVKRNAEAGRLKFTTDAAAGVAHGLFQFIAVGTPPAEDGSADLNHVLAVARSIGKHIAEYRVIVTKSTVPVGTAEKVDAAIKGELAARKAKIEYDVVSNPEFLKEGAAVDDFNKPDRVIIGSNSQKATDLMRALYTPFNRNHDRLLVMDVRSSELTKYAANAMLATKISFMNELANLSEKLGTDIERVRIGIGSDPRIGFHFIYPGCGYGGSCFPKDVQALVRTAQETGFEPALLQSVEHVNKRQKNVLFAKIKAQLGSLRGKTIGVWGLSFKPKTDDMREAPSRTLIDAILAEGGRVQAYDPVAMDEARRLYEREPNLVLVDSAEAAADGADALAIVTEWRMFQSPNFRDLKGRMKQPLIFDGRNLFDPVFMKDTGFAYHSIGRPVVVGGA